LPISATHQFRHKLARDILRESASLAEIGAVLAHQHIDATRTYAKIDLKFLHPLTRR